MNREEYIDKIIALYKLKYNPTSVEVAEFRLALEMMPNTNGSMRYPTMDDMIINEEDINSISKKMPRVSPKKSKPYNPYEAPISLLYGVVFPEYGEINSNFSDVIKEFNKNEFKKV